MLDRAVDTDKQLFMKFVLQLRTATQDRMQKYISTRTSMRGDSVKEKCPAPVRVDSSLAQILKIDMLDGLLASDTQFGQTETSLVQDVKASGSANASSSVNVNAATPMTLMLRIDDEVLNESGMDSYTIEVVTIFTMYFISNVKKESMVRLLNTGRGFTQFEDGSINPDDDLLRICPLDRIRGVYGCIARFEVLSGLHEFEGTSVLSIDPDEEICNLASETWAQAQRTASMSSVHAVSTHANRVRGNYSIDAKTRQAFLISQDVPWSEAEFINDASLSYLQYPQHSISIFSVNLHIADHTRPVSAQRITLSISTRLSENLALFSNYDAQVRIVRIQQVRSVISTVTGVHIDNIELRPDITHTLLAIVLSIPHHKSPYQEQRVRRLGEHLLRPGTNVRVRVEAMFAQVIETWLPDYQIGSEFAILGATVQVHDTPAGTPSPSMHRRRLLEESLPTTAPVSASTRRTEKLSWNHTSTFFVRSYDQTQNSDTMLDFSSTGGLFSRMCVISFRYSLALYGLQNEAQNLQAIDTRLTGPLRLASSGQILRSKAVALAPQDTSSCASFSPTKKPLATPRPAALPDPSPPPVRRKASVDTLMLLRVEIIVYSNTSGIFTLLGTQELVDAGVEQINVIPTKKTTNNLRVSLDTNGFLPDGSLRLHVTTATATTHSQDSPASTVTIVSIVVGVLFALACVGFVGLRVRHQNQCVEVQQDSAPRYTAMNIIGGGCVCLPHFDATATAMTGGATRDSSFVLGNCHYGFPL